MNVFTSILIHCGIIGGGGGNVFFTIMTGVLALKGNHGKSRLVEVTHCMKGME